MNKFPLQPSRCRQRVQAEGAGSRSGTPTGRVNRGFPKRAEQWDQRAVQAGAYAAPCVLVITAENNKYERQRVRKLWKIGVSRRLLLPSLPTSTRALQVLLQGQLTLRRTRLLQRGLRIQQQQEQPAPSQMEIFVVSDLMEAPADPPPENKLSSWDRNFPSRQIFNKDFQGKRNFSPQSLQFQWPFSQDFFLNPRVFNLVFLGI